MLLLATAAQGSLRDALVLLEQALGAGERPVTVAVARRSLGLTDPSILHALVTSLAGADPAGTLRAAAAAFDAGADPRQLFRDVARLARAAELVALGYPEGASVGPGRGGPGRRPRRPSHRRVSGCACSSSSPRRR